MINITKEQHKERLKLQRRQISLHLYLVLLKREPFTADGNGMIIYHAPAKAGCEYKLDNGAWQDSNVFNNIQRKYTYSFYKI